MPGVNRGTGGHSFMRSLLKHSKPFTAYQPLIESPSSPCHSAMPEYWHSLTGTWGTTGWWTCLTWIRVRGRNGGWGRLFVCVLAPHILPHGSRRAACAQQQWHGVKNGAWNWSDWFEPLWCHVHRSFLICATLPSTISLPKWLLTVQHRDCQLCGGAAWRKKWFLCRSSYLHGLWATWTLHPTFPPSIVLTSFPRSISSTISPVRRRRIWSMVAPCPNAPSRASGGSNGMSE